MTNDFNVAVDRMTRRKMWNGIVDGDTLAISLRDEIRRVRRNRKDALILTSLLTGGVLMMEFFILCALRGHLG